MLAWAGQQGRSRREQDRGFKEGEDSQIVLTLVYPGLTTLGCQSRRTRSLWDLDEVVPFPAGPMSFPSQMRYFLYRKGELEVSERYSAI